nr:tetratricopeptide repeat protein [Desulfobulbaceae bacterium]
MTILAVYWPIQTYDFINFDDPIYVINNLNIQNGLNWATIQWSFSTFHAGNWHPLTWLSHALDWQLYADFAGGHHRSNLIFHVANSLLLFTVLYYATTAIWPSFLCAFLLGIHPIHVESVVWISERKDVLCLFFTLLALLSYLKWYRSNKTIYFGCTHLLLVCALLSKPMAVTFPLLLLLIDFWPLQRLSLSDTKTTRTAILIPLLKEKSLMIFLCSTSAIITFFAQQSAGAVKQISLIPLILRVENALSSYSHYLLNIFWPTKLAIFYPYQHEIPIWIPLSAAFFFFCFIVTYNKCTPKFSFINTGILWFVCTLFPVIGLIQVGNQSHADRYMYIPAIGLYICLGWIVLSIKNSILRKCITTLLCSVLIVLPFVTRKQISTWHDSVSLFSHALSVTSNNDTAHTYLANAYKEQKNAALAVDHYQKALEINPKSIEALINLGVLSAATDITEAKRVFQQVLTYYPQNPEAYNNLANILKSEGKIEAAIALYQTAIQINPNYQSALFNLAASYDTIGNLDEAHELYVRSLTLNPNFAESHNGIGIVLAKRGERIEAIYHFEKALLINPQYESARRNLQKAYRLPPANTMNLIPN